MLTFIVLACHANVADPVDDGKTCKTFKEDIYVEEQVITPMSCMMQSAMMIMRFEEQHPGWKARKWTCKYTVREQDI